MRTLIRASLYSIRTMLTPGFATPEGTARFAARFPRTQFRKFGDSSFSLALSPLGLGTYLGADDDATDGRYAEAVVRALQLGINVLDSAINYRNQRSERAVGRALRSAGVPREELVISTKGGFVPRGMDTSILGPGELVSGCHAMTPRWLKDQLRRSRDNLGLDVIDIYYVHNPETQLGEVARPEFLRRMRAAFETLERAAADGHLRVYGTATWNGYRAAGQLRLGELVALAREVGGEAHRFRVVQLPYNQAMTEARDQGFFQAARASGIYPMISGSILQGKLARDLGAALRFVRDTPGVGTALVGMSRVAHVEQNAAVVLS
jgi:aryl-alcohol dehydrogenase-like predicted oxidoreductase